MKKGIQMLQSMGANPLKTVSMESLRGMFGGGIEFENALDWLEYENNWIEQLKNEPLRVKLTQAGRRKAKQLNCSGRGRA